MSVAIVLSVHNRPVKVLQTTIEALLENEGLDDAYLIVVDDGSDDEHKDQYEKIIWPMLDIDGEWLFTNTVAERPETYRDNPAYCLNLALESAVKSGAETTVLLSSGALLEASALKRALNDYPEGVAVLGKTIDSLHGSVLCSSAQITPGCWFVKAPTVAMSETGFDEAYLKGLSFEDKDFIGRLFLETKHIVIDDEIETIYQNHTWNLGSDLSTQEGEMTNKVYTKKKWGGIPFDRISTALNWITKSKKGKVDLLMPEALYLSQ